MLVIIAKDLSIFSFNPQQRNSSLQNKTEKNEFFNFFREWLVATPESDIFNLVSFDIPLSSLSLSAHY